ncbi:DsbC family protein [Zooshikella marina]|uniref:DsbC family protein n=1 Tax=Zooshikella ganghwensis TaxID=202772 RepID=UPI001BB08FB0|nr:DsbC family protein [Zooshikella ganghwensis]MBU2708718.1 DsbC family protein [Zooshikella ganghwensis]
MKFVDKIEVNENTLYIQFTSTGETQLSTLLNISQDISFFKEDKALIASLHGPDKKITLERFSSEESARRAYEFLQNKLQKYRRINKLSRIAKGIIKWGVLPLIGIVLALAINTAIAFRSMPVQNPQLAQSVNALAGQIPVTNQVESVSNENTPSPSAPTYQIPPPAELAKALNEGINAGDYAIPVSTTGKKRLYVFSDPQCPHCKNIEPMLDKLSKEYSVYVFPVSLIGGEVSKKQITKVLCAKPEERKTHWSEAIEDGSINVEPCAEGKEALISNEKIFSIMRFEGTPTLIRGDGTQFPLTQEMSYESVNGWMSAK